MALEYRDRVSDYTATTGTGTVTLAGTPPAGFRAFTAHTTGATVRYSISLLDESEWEVGEGVWTTSGATLTRVTVYASSNAGALVNFSAGTKIVTGILTAADMKGPGKGYAQSLTGAATTLTASYVDFLTASITTTGAGSNVVLSATVGALKTTATGNININLLWNGSEVAVRTVSIPSGYAEELTLTAVVTGVSAGAHTAKVQASYGTNGGTIGGTGYSSALIAEEQFV